MLQLLLAFCSPGERPAGRGWEEREEFTFPIFPLLLLRPERRLQAQVQPQIHMEELPLARSLSPSLQLGSPGLPAAPRTRSPGAAGFPSPPRPVPPSPAAPRRSWPLLAPPPRLAPCPPGGGRQRQARPGLPAAALSLTCQPQLDGPVPPSPLVGHVPGRGSGPALPCPGLPLPLGPGRETGGDGGGGGRGRANGVGLGAQGSGGRRRRRRSPDVPSVAMSGAGEEAEEETRPPSFPFPSLPFASPPPSPQPGRRAQQSRGRSGAAADGRLPSPGQPGSALRRRRPRCRAPTPSPAPSQARGCSERDAERGPHQVAASLGRWGWVGGITAEWKEGSQRNGGGDKGTNEKK